MELTLTIIATIIIVFIISITIIFKFINLLIIEAIENHFANMKSNKYRTNKNLLSNINNKIISIEEHMYEEDDIYLTEIKKFKKEDGFNEEKLDKILSIALKRNVKKMKIRYEELKKNFKNLTYKEADELELLKFDIKYLKMNIDSLDKYIDPNIVWIDRDT